MENFNLEYKFIGELGLLTPEILEKLNQKRIPIFFNDCDAKHWVFDFDIDGVIFEGIEVMPDCNNYILFNVAKDPFYSEVNINE